LQKPPKRVSERIKKREGIRGLQVGLDGGPLKRNFESGPEKIPGDRSIAVHPKRTKTGKPPVDVKNQGERGGDLDVWRIVRLKKIRGGAGESLPISTKSRTDR